MAAAFEFNDFTFLVAGSLGARGSASDGAGNSELVSVPPVSLLSELGIHASIQAKCL